MRATAVNLSLALLVAAAAACSAGAQPPTVNGRFPSLMVQIHDPPPRPPSLEGPPLSATRREPVSTRAGDAQDESVLPDVEGRYDEDCGPLTWEFRTFDGSCNNKCNIRFGAGNRGVLLHWRPRGDRPTGQDRPSPRAISNIVSRQAEERVPNRRRLSEFLTFFGQFIDHNFVATPSRKDAKQREESMNIPVADDDSSFRSTHNNSRSMTFGRSARATSYGRPSTLNVLPSYMDLSAVYGETEARARALRSFVDGRMKTSPGNRLPFNVDNLANGPSNSSAFYAAGDGRANEHVLLTIIHTVWMREHNALCKTLKRDFPRWGDERLYHMARKINGANFQRVVYEEWFPALTGRHLPEYAGYSKEADATVSSIFATATFRIGHTLVGPEVRRLGSGNVPLPPVRLGDVFFTSPRLLRSKPEEQFIRGMLGTRAQEVDGRVVDLLRNFLFSKVEGGQREPFDLIAQNIQRGRDHGIPPYNQIRQLMGRRRARDYDDISPDPAVAARFRRAYGDGNVDKVDAWVGLMSEPHITGASVGHTNYLVLQQEFVRNRAGDRFYYGAPGCFSRQVRASMSKHGGATMRDILLRNSRLSPHEVGSVFFASEPGHARRLQRPPGWGGRRLPTRHSRATRAPRGYAWTDAPRGGRRPGAPRVGGYPTDV